ncbi:MAG: hypothetical protein AABX51_07060 [Nanoarchaeota archaeon]
MNFKVMTIFIILLACINLVSGQTTRETIANIILEVTPDDGVKLISIVVDEGFATVFPATLTGYRIVTLSADKTILKSNNVGIFFTLTELETVSDNVLVQMRLPYNSSVELIDLYHERELIYQLNLAEKICNKNNKCEKYEDEKNCPADCGGKTQIIPLTPCPNSICDSSETYITCPQDCPSGSADKVCDRVKDGKCDPDCPASLDLDCTQTEIIVVDQKKDDVPVWLWLALFAIGTIFVILIVILLNRKQNPPVPPRYQQQYQRR